MVDVTPKPVTFRTATAEAVVTMRPATLRLVRRNAVEKGDVLGVARLAGIQAAKQTHHLVPLCHPLSLTRIEVDLRPEGGRKVRVHSTVTASDRTGVEMEALAAAGIAALTVYDMCKAVDRGMTIGSWRLLHKSGGKSGTYRR